MHSMKNEYLFWDAKDFYKLCFYALTLSVRLQQNGI